VSYPLTPALRYAASLSPGLPCAIGYELVCSTRCPEHIVLRTAISSTVSLAGSAFLFSFFFATNFPACDFGR
jgi:hypothetical protein